MNLLLENPLPIWAAGTVCLAISAIVFLARRTLASILGVVGVLSVTALLLFVERTVITPGEEVELAVASVMGAIEANDLPGVLAMIDPAAKTIRREAESLMPQVNVRETSATSVRVRVSESVNPLRATAFFRARVDGIHARSGSRLFYFDQVEVDWQRNGDSWQIVDYRIMHRGRQVHATEAFRGGR